MTYIKPRVRKTTPKFRVGQPVSVRFSSEHGRIVEYSVEGPGVVMYKVSIAEAAYSRWYAEKDLVLRM